jgi:hypothetical protein
MTFNSFECAIEGMAPRCAHCGCRIIGHNVEAQDRIYCCAHCAKEHHLAYVNNCNDLAKGTRWENKPIEALVKGTFGKNHGLFNNAGQHYNHIHFWKWMKPGGGGDKIPGELEKRSPPILRHNARARSRRRFAHALRTTWKSSAGAPLAIA